MMLAVNKADAFIIRLAMLYFVTVDTMKRQAVNITYRSQDTSMGIASQALNLPTLRNGLFCAFTQRVFVIAYRHFGKTISPISRVKNNPEERSSHLLRGGSLKSTNHAFISLK
jgi:hypothetical protein